MGWGWGLLRGGAESTSKIPRHLFTQGRGTGRRKAGRPTRGSARGSRGGTPDPPDLSQAPTPSQQRWPAQGGGGGRRSGDRTGGVKFRSCCATGGSSEGENQGPGGLCGVEILQRRMWKDVCQARSPQSTHRHPPQTHNSEIIHTQI